MPFTHAVSTNNYGPSHIIVSTSAANGTHTSLTAALADAISGDTIFVRDGTYVEDFSLIAGVNITSYSGNGYTPNVTIQGNITAAYTGSVTISGIKIITNGAACLTTSGSNTGVLYLFNCSISGTDSTAMVLNNSNFVFNVISSLCSTSSNNLLFAITSIAGIAFRSCELAAGTAANTIESGPVNIFNCAVGNFSITTSSTGSFNVYNTFIDNSAANQTIFTMAGTGASKISNCQLFSGSASTISIGTGCTAIVALTELTSSNTNVITGAGTLQECGLAFMGSSTATNVTTTTGVGLPAANGTAGQILKSNGAGTIPTFQT